MEIRNTFNALSNTPDLQTAMEMACGRTAEEFNCVRIAIVQEVYNDGTCSVLIANKRENKLNNNGTQQVRNFALIRAKICFCNPFITNPINVGDECVLLFSDREIESWFINGQVNPIAYTRMHDLTDAIAIFGIRSLPKMITLLTDCLNLFYGESSIQIKNNSVVINTDKIKLGKEECIDDGNHIVSNGTVITTKNGIITSIS